jgi:hypothetical protein
VFVLKRMLINLSLVAVVGGSILAGDSAVSAANKNWSFWNECGGSGYKCDYEEHNEYWKNGSIKEEVSNEWTTPRADWEEVRELGQPGAGPLAWSADYSGLHLIRWVYRNKVANDRIRRVISCAEYAESCNRDGICGNYTPTYYFGCPSSY